jgi:hypothetical protein
MKSRFFACVLLQNCWSRLTVEQIQSMANHPARDTSLVNDGMFGLLLFSSPSGKKARECLPVFRVMAAPPKQCLMVWF